MPPITQRKKMSVVRYYLQGYSYQEIADRAGVAKGSTVTILADLKDGKFRH